MANEGTETGIEGAALAGTGASCFFPETIASVMKGAGCWSDEGNAIEFA